MTTTAPPTRDPRAHRDHPEGGPTWPQRLSTKLTSKWGARASVLLGILIATIVMGALATVQAPPRGDGVPTDAEAAVVAAELAKLPDSGVAPVLLVATPTSGEKITEAQLDELRTLGQQLGEQTGHEASPPRPSEDGQAAMVALPVTLGAELSDDAETVKAVRAAIADNPPAGLDVVVTGGPAFGADIASAFDGANITLLLVTVSIVAILLLLTYRSPILWLVPLTVVAFADQVAGRVGDGLGNLSGLDFDAGILSVLVFGAGTNYALLLISRYREELRVEEDHRVAMSRAWRGSAPAILASNLTVVLALLTLLLAVVPSTRGLGLTSAAGLLVALAAILLVLPGALVMCGRRVFWPFIPRAGDGDDSSDGIWGRIAAHVVKRPVAVLGGGLALLAILASGLIGTRVGLSQEDSFRGDTESATGLVTMSKHFPAGEAAPFDVVTDPAHVEAVTTAVEGVPGVDQVIPPREATGDIARITVIGAPAPGTPESLDLARDLRTAAHDVPDANALVGGGSATTLDAQDAASRDLRVIVPLVLLVNVVVLFFLLRSVVAPIVLLGLNVASAVAAMGLGSFLSERVLGFPALDSVVPLIAFLFLVALGIDYTIFLVHRARAEARRLGTRDGMVKAVGRTGAVITSAGIVLAAVFAALGVLPLVLLAQVGLIVGLGVLIDTLLVRTMLVPAAVALLGDRFWWPATVKPAAPAIEADAR